MALLSSSRRSVAGAALALAGVVTSACVASAPPARATTTTMQPGLTVEQAAALRALGRTTLRAPGTLPDPSRPAGTDTLPGVGHIVVLMLENHSFDNVLGMLGRGDGFTLVDGQPTATNPYGDGRVQHAFHMPTTCQLASTPSQEWQASHNAYDNGRNDGFVSTTISPGTTQKVGGVAMGYWTGADLPFTYSLASTFPIADRWFSSALAQTDPERRFLIGATAAAMTDDIGTGPGNAVADSTLSAPAPTIFNELDTHNLSWADYAYSYPLGASPELFPATDAATEANHHKSFDQFYADAQAGSLPDFSILDEDYSHQSQENPQNVAAGDGLLAKVVDALGTSPEWDSTMLVVTYDEGGGYYDHVPPPAALPPDAVPPAVQPGESTYDGYARYGFRVPAVVVSAYAKRNYVSHTLYDHTSILAMVERKWNLPALTYRDANANDLTAMLDMKAMAGHRPTFKSLPRLAAPGDTPAAMACSKTGPGTVPPPGSVTG